MAKETPSETHVIALATLKGREAVEVSFTPDADQRAAIAKALGLTRLRKATLAGRLIAEGGRDWRLEAKLGATVVQPCVVTLEPVTTRIDEPLQRRYLAEPPEPGTGEVEMPEDDSVEELPDEIDLAQLFTEALAIAVPAYPRAPGAELATGNFAPPGVDPLTDDDLKPFAGLSDLVSGAKNDPDRGPGSDD